MDLKIENLSKHFGSKTAVDRINLHMHEGIYGFLGANRGWEDNPYEDCLRDT